MKKISPRTLLLVAFMFIGSGLLQAQLTVGLDNWFNRETRNGKPFHYLWNDSTESGYSKWGEMFSGNNATLITLGKPSKTVLDKANIYIIADPDTTKENPSPNYILPDDIKVITQWVKNGGVLIILANDAPNCEFTHLNKLTANFGMVFNHVSLRPVTGTQWEMGAFTNLPSHPVFQNVRKIYMKEVSSLTLSGKAKPVLEENKTVFMAECPHGKGFVFAVGDPWIYNEYIDHERLTNGFDNKIAAENLTHYLLKHAKEKK